jgi:Ca2+-binding RTX toxin-like protein
LTDGFLSLFGGEASDTLTGGALADLIHGNLGAGQLTGNGGADVFRYQGVGESTASSLGHILDFEAGVDKVDLRGRKGSQARARSSLDPETRSG